MPKPKHDERCPNCGQFVKNSTDADGYFGRLAPFDDLAQVAIFCDSECCEQYENKTRRIPRCIESGCRLAVYERNRCYTHFQQLLRTESHVR